MKRHPRYLLPAPLRRLLLTILREGELVRVGGAGMKGHIYCSGSGETFQLATVVSAGDRFLVRIIVDGRKKPIRETVLFTETGELVAKALAQIEKETPLAPDDFEQAEQVYSVGDEAERN